jgi:hypothetical protein
LPVPPVPPSPPVAPPATPVVECAPGGAGGQLVTIEMPLELHRDPRQAVIEHGSTGMSIVFAAVYAAHPELLASAQT